MSATVSWLNSSDSSQDSQVVDSMKSFGFLIMPALVGLVAGIAHGVISHQTGLPLGLVEQLSQVVESEHISFQ